MSQEILDCLGLAERRVAADVLVDDQELDGPALVGRPIFGVVERMRFAPAGRITTGSAAAWGS
jgi:hypothetical protein